MVLWAALGAGAGLLAAIALSEWVGEVNSGRVRRIAERLREQGPTRLTAAASARAVQVALNAEPRLAGLPIEARAVSRGAVELRGWVPSRSMPDRRRPHGPRRPRHRERDQQPPGARRGRSPLARPATGGRPERMTAPLAPQYDPSEIESQLYAWWRERDLFSPEGAARARGGPPGEPYVIQMPPPNVTAELHMGHGLNNTVQDVLIRFERMRGRRALWVPGTDHAGIATQNVVERLLAKEGLTRFDLGREAFVERVWAHVRETGARILQQLQAIGCSADWSRTYFTLDEDLSRAVREVFVRLYEKGLIYRGHYIINWCPRCLTALSNEEAEKEEVDGRHLAHPLSRWRTATGTSRSPPRGRRRCWATPPWRCTPTTSATASWWAVSSGCRSPTGGSPWSRTKPWIPTFGSGAVKVTPAHDPTDFEIGRRQGLPSMDVMTPEARMSLAAPERFQGLDRFEARKQVVAELGGAGPAGEGGEPPSRGGSLLPLRHRDRAPALGAVVRADGAARPPGARALPRRDAPVHPRAPGRRLRALAGGDPRLVHLPAALVGSPHSGLVLRGRGLRPGEREPDRPRPPAPAAAVPCARTRTCSTPGSPPGWCRSPVSAGPSRRTTSRRTTPATPWSPRPRSCSSGSRG